MSANNHRKHKGVIKPDKTVEVSSIESFMPDPETLKELEVLCPGATERWMKMAEAEVYGRQKNERAIVVSYRFNTIMSPIFGFIVSLGVLSIGFYCIYIGHPATGGIIITSGIASTVLTLVAYKKVHKSEEK